MFSKNNKKMIIQKEQEKINYYGIKKFNAGTASVLIAAGFAFLGGGSALASNDTAVNATSETENNNLVTANKDEVSTTTPVKVNKTNLSAAIARVQEAISNAGVTEKTASAIEDAKAELATAQVLEASEVATQAEVNKVTVELKNKAFVLESMKKATAKEEDKPTEEKVNKNQDPRNGQAIPGKGESGFRADKFIVDKSNSPQLPDTTTTGTDKFTFVALPENDSARNSGAIARGDGRAGDIIVKGTGAAPTDLEIEMYSSQRTGQAENPVAMSTEGGRPVTSPGRMDYPLSPESVKKLSEEAPLWVGKLKPDGNTISTNPATVFGSSGGYEFLATEIYKMGYEQGVDRAYIPNISNRFAVTDKAKEAGWKIKSISPTNLPSGLIYDKESDSIQGRVISSVQNGVQDLRFTVEAENEKTHQIVSMEFRNLRSGWIAWQDSKPPKLEVSDDAYETQVGKNVNIDIAYKDDAGSNFSGSRRQVNYKLASGKVVTIPNQQFRQAVSGLAGYATTSKAGELDGTKTSIPGISYSLSQDGTPVETDENGDQSIYGKAKLSGTATTAGIYTVSVYAKDYNTTQRSDSTWIHSGHEVQKYITVVVKPTVTVKNIHAYATNIPVTISDGASTAEITLPNGKVTKLEAKNGKWVVSAGTTNEKAVVGTELGAVGGEINIPVSQEDTKDAAIDTIKAKATTENVKATLLRNKIELQDAQGGKHTATLSEKTGHWELEDTYKEVKTPTADGVYQLTKRQVYTEVQTDGSVNYYIYSYTRTFNAQDEVVSVDSVTRDKTVLPRLNTSTPEGENTVEGGTTVVEYDAVKKEWKSSDGSNVTATKEGDFWKVETTSGFTGLVKGSKAEAEDKASILNDAPVVTSTSYTTVKGATVDLVKQKSATVTITDSEDDTTTDPTKKETVVTKVTLTAPSRKVTEYTSVSDAATVKLTETGDYTVKVDVKDSNGNKVTATNDTETGTNAGEDTAVASTTYKITVKDQVTNKLYTVEDDTLTSDQLKEKVNPTAVDGFTPTKNDITNIPATSGKAGQTLPTPATVTYTKGTETISVETTVDVVVLPKIEPTGVTVLKDSTGLEEVVKAKAVEAANAVPTDKLPDGVTVSVKEVKQGTVPATSTTGVQTPAKVVVEYKDANDNVVETREVEVPVTVVSSTPSKIVVFEGEKPTADQAKAAVTPGTGGTVETPAETALPETVGKAGAKDVKVDVPVTYDNGKLTETVSVPVTVLPKATGEVDVPKGESVGKVKEVAKTKATALVEEAAFKGKLPTGATVTVGDITEAVAETLTNEKGTNKGVVNVPATYTVEGTTYNTTIPVTINVLGSEAKPVYTVEGTKPDAEKVKNAVTPGTGGTVGTPTETDLPETTGKAGATDVTATTTVTYPNGTETVPVPVTVLPKATPEKVTTLKDTTSDNLTTAVKEKAQAALGKLTLPSGVTAELVPNQNYNVPATTSNGDKDNVPVKVQYKDAKGTVVAEDTINVPVTVVSSTSSKVVVFEGEKPTADQAKAAVTSGTGGTVGTPAETALPETAGKAGAKDVKVDVPVTYDNGKLTETVSVPVTVLPKPEAEEILVAKNSDKEKAKEKVLAKAKKAIEDATFKDKLPQGATVTVDETATITVPDLTEDTEVDVPVKYTVDGQEKTTKVKVPVTVVEGVPQIVPVKENNDVLPDPEKSIDKTDYPQGSTFRYKTPDGQTTPIDVTSPGDKNVVVEVLDSQGNTIVEVPATVRVVESYPQFVPVDKDKKQPAAERSIAPKAFPKDTEFSYETPVDTTTPGEKEVVVVAKIGDKVIAKVPAKVMVVEPKTQYVPVDKTNKQPDASKSINPEQYPDGTTFEYKTPVDTTTPGEKDVVVVAKDGEDKLVEVPAKVKVVEGKEQLIPINATGENQPKPKDSITPSDYPEDSTFEYKVPEGQVTPYDGTTPGDKPVTVVVKDKNGKVLVEVPATIKVVEVKPKPIETPVTTTPLTQEDYTKGITIPKGGKVTKVENIPDLTTPGKKEPVKVTITLPNGKTYIVDVPVTVTPVKEIETPVTTTPLTPEDYTKVIAIPKGGKVTKVENIPDLTTPGKKDPVKVTVELPNGKVITVEVPVNVTPVKEIETPVTKTPLTPEDYTKGIIIPKGGKVTKVENIPDLTTPGKKDPVKVTVELPNGKVITVEVPVNVTPITPIETQVTKDKLTPEDILKQIKVPEGATVKVGERPDLTTPGKKDPVKVTVELPNGKVVTVEVPVNVTPIEDIVKKQGDSITNEDVEKHIKIPTGGKVISIGDKPSTDISGERPSIPVVIELPNGIRVTINIPVIVTPKATPVVVPVGTPVTPEDVKKHIELPKGWTVTKVGKIPTTTTPGTKPVVPVEIELPDGRKITVDVPVIVTPTVRQIVVPQGTPITPDDVKGHIDLPKEPGWEFIEVGEIPATIPAGVKPSVKVKIKIPSGEIVEVDVPVLVTPKGRPIVVEVGTPITEDDVIKQIDLPEGWEIVEVGEIPTTETPGQKPSVKVKVKLPTGEIIEIEVSVTVTPKVVPTTPSTPTSPTRTENQKEPVVKDTSKVLPNTGINDSSSPLAGFGLAILGLATLVRRRKQK